MTDGDARWPRRVPDGPARARAAGETAPGDDTASDSSSGSGSRQNEVEIVTGRVTGETTVPVESATVILLRDPPRDPSGPSAPSAPSPEDGRFQVFMLERHVESDFAGGAYAFPGGKVDERDRDLDPLRWNGIDLPATAERMGADADLTLGWHVAAVRETFEEAGFLLAQRGGDVVGPDLLARASYVDARRRLASRDDDWDWRPWLADEDLVLDLGALAWWSWWVTPHGLHKRYETRFFAARVPENQIGAHDDVEVTDSLWIDPGEALRRAAERQATIIYPTRKNLEALAGYCDVDRVMAAARAEQVDLRRTLPEIVRLDGDTIRIRHPFTGELEDP